MKRIGTMLSLLLALGAATGTATAQQQVKTSVEAVTLFVDGAQITRTKRMQLPAGNTTLVFTGLSPYLDEKSMQVNAKGPFTVTAVERLFNYTDSLERSALRQKLEQRLDAIEQQRKKLKASREVLEAENDLLKVNCSVGNRNVSTPLASIRELNEYYAAQLQTLKEKQLALDERERKLADEERQLRKELAQAGGKKSEPMSEIQVQLTASAACTGTFTLTYYVRNAGWFPSYDIRSEGLSEPLEISYKANLFQNTREEWKDVTLTLSSSNPSTGNIAPQLRTYWLDYGLAAPRYDTTTPDNTVSGTVFDLHREPLVGATVMIPGTTVGTSTDLEGRYSLTIPDGKTELQFTYVGFEPRTVRITGPTLNVALRENTAALDEVVVTAYGSAAPLAGRVAGVAVRNDKKMRTVETDEAEVEASMMEVEQSQNRLGYEFEIKRPYTVGSDGKTVTAEIGRYRLPAAYSYRSTPKIDKDAFLTAEASDWEKLNLLQGEASIYFENTFVGKTILDPMQASDTLRFSLGRDNGIRIERTKQSDYSARRAIGSNRTQTMAWKIVVRNTRREPVALTLYDQIPVSRNSTIAVSEEELSGGSLDRTTGIVSWPLQLGPGEQRELQLRYSVKYPKGRYLTIE